MLGILGQLTGRIYTFPQSGQLVISNNGERMLSRTNLLKSDLVSAASNHKLPPRYFRARSLLPAKMTVSDSKKGERAPSELTEHSSRAYELLAHMIGDW